jgi:hypothetical protein
MKVRLTVSTEDAEIVRSEIYRFISDYDAERRRDPPYVGLTLMPIRDGWDCHLEFDGGVDEFEMARFSALLGGYGRAVRIDPEPSDHADRPAVRAAEAGFGL